MIGTMITIWLLLMGIYYLCVAGFRIVVSLPKIVSFVLLLPAMPFVVAYRNRKERPGQAKAIYILWGLLYALTFLVILLG